MVNVNHLKLEYGYCHTVNYVSCVDVRFDFLTYKILTLVNLRTL